MDEWIEEKMVSAHTSALAIPLFRDMNNGMLTVPSVIGDSLPSSYLWIQGVTNSVPNQIESQHYVKYGQPREH